MILSLTNGQEVNLHATWLLNKFAAFTKLKGSSLMLKLLILNYEIVMVALMICVLFDMCSGGNGSFWLNQ